jgi:adenylate kinase
MRLVLIGPPGSGKGTQAKLLVERLGCAYIGTGDILRDAIRRKTPIGLQAEPIIKSGRLVPDDVVNEMVADRFRQPDRPDCFVLDGYPRTLAQAASFDQFLRQQFLDLDAVVQLVIDDEEVVSRMLARQRADDKEETIRERLRVFHETTDDLVEHYRRQGLLREVSALQPVETIYDQIATAGPNGKHTQD